MPESASPPIVDGHAHIFTKRMPLAQSAWTHPDYEYPVEAYLAELDRHGIGFGVLSAATLYGDYNDYTLEVLRAHRRLRGTVIAKPETSAAAVKEMADCGVVGVRLAVRRLAEPLDLRGDLYRGFLKRLADLNMHVELLARAPQMPGLLPALNEAGVRVVIDHFGGPEAEEGLDGPGFTAVLRAFDTGGAWVKISAAHRIAPELAAAAAQRLLVAGGPERLIWGSDAPFVGHEATTDYSKALARFETHIPDARTRWAISQTALKLYFQ